MAVLVFPGAEELDFVGFLEVLAVANRVCGRRYFDTVIVGTEDGPIRCRGGMNIVPDVTLTHMGSHDLFFVPGGGAGTRTGVELLAEDRGVLKAIRESYSDGNRVWSVCTGALVLGKAGLLRGRKATTHHSYLERIRESGAKVVRRRVVKDGRVTTGGGISSSIDVGLALVEEDLGKAVRREVQTRMEYPPDRGKV